MDKDAFVRQRRNLILFSVGILVFVIGGGSIKEIPSIFGAIELQHKEVIYAFIGIGFIYSWWRYWLSAQDMRSNISIELKQSQYECKTLLDIGRKYHPVIPENHGGSRENVRPVFTFAWSESFLNYSRAQNSSSGNGPGISGVTGIDHIAISRSDALRLKVFPYFYLIFKKNSSAEYALPYILAFSAVLAIVWKVSSENGKAIGQFICSVADFIL